MLGGTSRDLRNLQIQLMDLEFGDVAVAGRLDEDVVQISAGDGRAVGEPLGAVVVGAKGDDGRPCSRSIWPCLMDSHSSACRFWFAGDADEVVHLLVPLENVVGLMVVELDRFVEMPTVVSTSVLPATSRWP